MSDIEQARELLAMHMRAVAKKHNADGLQRDAEVVESGEEWDFWMEAAHAAVAAALRAAPEVCELRICETRHLALKPNQLYRFTVDPNCDACTDAAATAAPVATLSTVTPPRDLRTKLGDA